MLILASQSPRRRELLKKITTDFKVIPADIDERGLHLPPSALAAEESKEKAYALSSLYPNDEVLACDTIVVLGDKVLGKPIDEEDAIRMLMEESGKRQIVLSGYTYIGKGVEITRTVATTVFFKKIDLETAKRYVETKKPLDKAGAYGIQDEFGLIERIEGSYDNVMGFPTEDIALHCPITRQK